eukprot:5821210-Alexandrium_andersonii.AAC.1
MDDGDAELEGAVKKRPGANITDPDSMDGDDEEPVLKKPSRHLSKRPASHLTPKSTPNLGPLCDLPVPGLESIGKQ